MLLVHIADPSPRAKYVIEHVLHHMLGWDLAIIDDLEAFQQSSGPKLSYGAADADPSGYHVRSSGWLNEKKIRPFEPELADLRDIPVIFPDQNGFDVFAAVFYLISRYEEYLDHEKDQHGRFRSSDHFVVKHALERTPIVDRWALSVAEELQRKFPELPPPDRRYRHVVTVDMDNGLKYLGRPFWKQGGAAIRDLVKGAPLLAQERIAVLRGTRPDPFADQFLLMQAARSQQVARMIVFMLVQGGKPFDHAADISHPEMGKLLAKLADGAELGLHPSYGTSDHEPLIMEEKQRLEVVSRTAITASRQHFLRWRLPETLRSLEAAGIQEDHSLGFSDRIGFRAGTCTPFRWYDLQQDRVSDLVLHPFAAMDSALHDRMELRPKEAASEMIAMSDAVRAVSGQFVSVWHDRFLSGHGERKGWPEAFKQVCDAAAP